MSQTDVAEITSAFIAEIRMGLVDDGEVRIDGLGRLRLVDVIMSQGTKYNLTLGTGKKKKSRGKIKVEVPRQLKVYFSKSPTLTKMLRAKLGGKSWIVT
jgi:nucleoid DNA-binding protein